MPSLLGLPLSCQGPRWPTLPAFMLCMSAPCQVLAHSLHLLVFSGDQMTITGFNTQPAVPTVFAGSLEPPLPTGSCQGAQPTEETSGLPRAQVIPPASFYALQVAPPGFSGDQMTIAVGTPGAQLHMHCLQDSLSHFYLLEVVKVPSL